MSFRYEVTFNPQAIKQTILRQARPILQDAAFDLRARFAAGFGGVKTGRIYRRPPPARRTYRASGPGEPPAIRSGNLLRSISMPTFPSPHVVQLAIRAPYARFLERGTPRMAARPFVQPSIRELIKRFREGKL